MPSVALLILLAQISTWKICKGSLEGFSLHNPLLLGGRGRRAERRHRPGAGCLKLSIVFGLLLQKLRMFVVNYFLQLLLETCRVLRVLSLHGKVPCFLNL
jgi:hypothetical protein